MSLIEVRGFDWDDDSDVNGNTFHCFIDHGLRTWEVESAFFNDPLWIREISIGTNPYYTVIGETDEGQLLEVHGALFQNPPKKYWFRPVTAFPCRRRLSERYYNKKRR